MSASSKARPFESFPPPDQANEEGLLAVGGDLSTERLLLAYSSGIFPWFEDGLPVMWWSPDPRAVIELDRLHVSRRLARTMRRQPLRVTVNHAFADVMRACGESREEGTWITPSMIEAYSRLHRIGHAHSVEVWACDDAEAEEGPLTPSPSHPKRGEGLRSAGARLVGGIYGVAIGGFFAGESMFHRVRDASKIAIVHLVERLRSRGFELFDVQILNEHTARLGAIEIPRRDYLCRLRHAITLPVRFD